VLELDLEVLEPKQNKKILIAMITITTEQSLLSIPDNGFCIDVVLVQMLHHLHQVLMMLVVVCNQREDGLWKQLCRLCQKLLLLHYSSNGVLLFIYTETCHPRKDNPLFIIIAFLQLLYSAIHIAFYALSIIPF
jgi:hypothetical protein